MSEKRRYLTRPMLKKELVKSGIIAVASVILFFVLLVNFAGSIVTSLPDGTSQQTSFFVITGIIVVGTLALIVTYELVNLRRRRQG